MHVSYLQFFGPLMFIVTI